MTHNSSRDIILTINLAHKALKKAVSILVPTGCLQIIRTLNQGLNQAIRRPKIILKKVVLKE